MLYFHWEIAPKITIKQPLSFVLNASLSDYFIPHIISCIFRYSKNRVWSVFVRTLVFGFRVTTAFNALHGCLNTFNVKINMPSVFKLLAWKRRDSK